VNGALTANPAQASYERGATVAVTATPRAGYRLAAWGGDCATTPAASAMCTLTIDADRTVRATFAAVTVTTPLRLTVFTSGRADGEVILEWSGDAAGATGWQYRLRGPVWQGVQYRRSGTEWVAVAGEVWGSWTDIPGSTPTTRNYRLSVLRGGFGYDFEVRPKATGAQAARFMEAVASLRGSDGTPYAYPATYLERGQKFRIHRTAYTFTVPAGMTLVMGRGMFNSDGSVTVALWDAQTGSVLVVDAGTGAGRGRHVVTLPDGDPSSASAAATGARDVGALFDQIVQSIAKAPLP
jgi:hypothetical protein